MAEFCAAPISVLSLFRNIRFWHSRFFYSSLATSFPARSGNVLPGKSLPVVHHRLSARHAWNG
jgi:hypothetical protein